MLSTATSIDKAPTTHHYTTDNFDHDLHCFMQMKALGELLLAINSFSPFQLCFIKEFLVESFLLNFSFLSTAHPCVGLPTKTFQPIASASYFDRHTSTRLHVARGLVGYGYYRAHHRPGPTRPGPTTDKVLGRPEAGPPSPPRQPTRTRKT